MSLHDSENIHIIDTGARAVNRRGPIKRKPSDKHLISNEILYFTHGATWAADRIQAGGSVVGRASRIRACRGGSWVFVE